MSLGKILKIDDMVKARLESILTFCTNKIRRTFTVGRPPYTWIKYKEDESAKIFLGEETSLHQGKKLRTNHQVI